jgi:PKD repeat protein
VYADDGVYSVQLMVTDDAGLSASLDAMAMIANVTPTVTAAGNQSIDEGSLLSLTVASFSDPGFTSAAAGTQETFAATISWGDGTAPESGTVSVTQGSAGVRTIGTVSGQHTYRDNGTYTVTVSVADDDLASQSASFMVTVRNVAPRVLTASNLIGNEGQSLNFMATFSDPGILDTHTAIVFWSDGSQSPGLVTEANGLGTVTSSHVFADNGVYPVRVEVTDNAGEIGRLESSATIANATPTLTPAMNQTADEGTMFSLTVATFTDPGFTNAAAGTVETFSATIDWGDGSALEPATVSFTPGSAGVPSTGMVSTQHTYVDDGLYTVTVTVTDDDLDSGQTSFTVNVRNVAPTVLTASTPAGNEGSMIRHILRSGSPRHAHSHGLLGRRQPDTGHGHRVGRGRHGHGQSRVRRQRSLHRPDRSNGRPRRHRQPADHGARSQRRADRARSD